MIIKIYAMKTITYKEGVDSIIRDCLGVNIDSPSQVNQSYESIINRKIEKHMGSKTQVYIS